MAEECYPANATLRVPRVRCDQPDRLAAVQQAYCLLLLLFGVIFPRRGDEEGLLFYSPLCADLPDLRLLFVPHLPTAFARIWVNL